MTGFEVKWVEHGPIVHAESQVAYLMILHPVTKTEVLRMKNAIQWKLKDEYPDMNLSMDYCYWNKREVGIMTVPSSAIEGVVQDKERCFKLIEEVLYDNATRYGAMYLDTQGQAYVLGNYDINNYVSIDEDDESAEQIVVYYKDETSGEVELYHATVINEKGVDENEGQITGSEEPVDNN